jgi:hypothetical protein
MTCGCYEDVYAGLEWDIVNVSLPTMTLNHLAVNLSLDTEKEVGWVWACPSVAVSGPAEIFIQNRDAVTLKG